MLGRGRRALFAVQVAGELLVTLGAVTLLFCAYGLFYTGAYTGQEQASLSAEVKRNWQRPAQAPVGPAPIAAPSPGSAGSSLNSPRATATGLGRGVAVLTAPRLGASWRKIAVEGVRVRDLRRGPGHYPGTAMPGEIGNSVFSGHRTTYGAPFNRLDRLREGDEVAVQTANGRHVYKVIRKHVVRPWQIDVAHPVPGRPGAVPTERLLTLTTCHPKYSARQRLIVVARLDRTEPAA